MIPRKIQYNDNIKSETMRAVNEIIDYLKSTELKGDNRTISISHHQNGMVITSLNEPVSKATESVGGSNTTIYANPIPAIVGNGTDLTGYAITLYANGYNQDSTGYGTAFIIQGNAQQRSISYGTKIMVYPYANFIETVG